jgi:SPOR domain
MAPEQDWCLECGTEVTTRVARPPGWAVPVAIVVAVLAIAGAIVFITIGQLDDDADNAAGSRAATPTPQRAATSTTKTSTVSGAVEAQGGGPVPLWPRRQEAYTIVVAAPSRRAAAEGRARALIARGRDAGILRSDDYDFFGSGVWVVWRGKYPDKATAEKNAPKVKAVYPSAYVTFIRRKS